MDRLFDFSGMLVREPIQVTVRVYPISVEVFVTLLSKTPHGVRN